MSLLSFLAVGLIAGWVASFLVEGRGLGLVGDLVVGIIGALVGGIVFYALGVNAIGFWESIGMSAIGAIILLFILRLFTGPKTSPRS